MANEKLRNISPRKPFPKANGFADKMRPKGEEWLYYPKKAGSASRHEPQRDHVNLSILSDVPVQVSAVLGRTSMQISDLLKLGRGAVVELDRRVGDPIDIFVNDRLVARGELTVSDEKLGVKLTQIIKADKAA